MATRDVQVTGLEQVLQNLMRLQNQIRVSVPTGLDMAADALRDAAILNLQAKLGTSSGRRWGHSIEQQAISDKQSWVKEHPKWNQINLMATSEHAAIVEFGGTKIVEASEYGHKVWPIGASEGLPIEPWPRFKLQVGYHYLTSSIDNPTVTSAMLSEMSKVLSRTIATAGK